MLVMLKPEAAKMLKSAGVNATEDMLELPPQEELGDVSFPCFELSKIQRKNPNEIAKDIKDRIKITKSSLVEKVDTKGGYVNIFFNWDKVAEKLLKDIGRKTGDYGKADIGKGKVALVEYSSPNPIHPIHIGSGRNTIIGESVSRILEFADYKVKRLLFLNDLGRQVAVLIRQYLKHMADAKPEGKEDRWLLDVYVKANKELADNPDLEREVDDILKNCEFKDKEAFEILRRIVGWCLKGFEKTYSMFGIKYDEYVWESDFVEKARLYAEDLLKDKFAFATADGAVVIRLEPHGLPDTVLLRHDGTTLYLIRDVASSIYKIEKYKPDLNIYVVGEDQNLHFKQQFKILELLGYKSFVEKSAHLSYGLVSLPGGKMSSRLGKVVLLDDMVDEAVKKVKEKFNVKDENTASAIAKGAITYSMLRVEARKQVLFKWEDVLSLEGNSGPYIQYAYARCCSILEKAGDWEERFSLEGVNEYEKRLLKNLMLFNDVAEKATKELRPDVVCNYAYDLATAFNAFYQFCSVLNADTEELKNFRLSLVNSVKIVLGNVLDLLNIEKLERV